MYRDHESDTGNPSGQPSTSLGVVMPRDYKIIKTKSDGESGNQLDDDDEQKVIDQMRAVGKQAFWLHKRLHINQKLNESVEGTENSLVDLQLYLLDVEEYLKTVPNHLQQIQEYKKLKKRYEEAKIACTYATEWLQSSKSWHKYPSDEALLIDGVSNH